MLKLQPIAMIKRGKVQARPAKKKGSSAAFAAHPSKKKNHPLPSQSPLLLPLLPHLRLLPLPRLLPGLHPQALLDHHLPKN